jgi:hypothetical protein
MDVSPSTLSRLRLLYCAFIGKDAGQGGLLHPRYEISSEGARGYGEDVKDTTIKIAQNGLLGHSTQSSPIA